MTRGVTVHDVWALPQGERVVLNSNKYFQAVDDNGGVLGTFLGGVAGNFNKFPISYETWRDVPKQSKYDAFQNIVQVLHIPYYFVIHYT